MAGRLFFLDSDKKRITRGKTYDGSLATEHKNISGRHQKFWPPPKFLATFKSSSQQGKFCLLPKILMTTIPNPDTIVPVLFFFGQEGKRITMGKSLMGRWRPSTKIFLAAAKIFGRQNFPNKTGNVKPRYDWLVDYSFGPKQKKNHWVKNTRRVGCQRQRA